MLGRYGTSLCLVFNNTVNLFNKFTYLMLNKCYLNVNLFNNTVN